MNILENYLILNSKIDYNWSADGEEISSIRWAAKIEHESRNMCNFVFMGRLYLVGGGEENSDKQVKIHFPKTFFKFTF